MKKRQTTFNLLLLILFVACAFTCNAQTGKNKPKFDIVGKDTVYYDVDKMPQYPGGQNEILQFISRNIKYPVRALENKEEGRVIVRFIVSRTGKTEQVNVFRGISESLDKEALRVISLLKGWIPGEQNGEKVCVWYTLPIVFKNDVQIYDQFPRKKSRNSNIINF